MKLAIPEKLLAAPLLHHHPMSSAIPIKNGRAHQNSHYTSAGSPSSPVTVSPLNSYLQLQSNIGTSRPKALKPFAVNEIKLLLLENISAEAVEAFRKSGFRVDHHTKAWSEDELVAKIGDYQAIGIRSKTKITERVLQAAPNVRVQLSFISVLGLQGDVRSIKTDRQ